MKANHNRRGWFRQWPAVVSSTTKIVKWKQITTEVDARRLANSCFQYDKDSKMKANHNRRWAKIPKDWGCFQYDKDSKMKANHNWNWTYVIAQPVVSSTTKIVKWKQITTVSTRQSCHPYVVSSTTKIVKWKQITTHCECWATGCSLFPVRQR